MTCLDSETLTAVAQLLAAQIPLLQSFTHRNKNQHHASHWFPSLSLLRRSLRRLEAELLPLRRNGTWRRLGKDEAKLIKAVRWLKDTVIPRCYPKFTQLMADNQHAALGLFLLTVLAQVNTLVNRVLPDKPPSPLATFPTAEPQPLNRNDALNASVTAEDQDGKEDRGVAILRDVAMKASPPASSLDPGAPSAQVSKEAATEAKNLRIPKTKKTDDNHRTLDGGIRSLDRVQAEVATVDAPAMDQKSNKKKEKEKERGKSSGNDKKKKKKKDEFSSLFGSLS